MSYLPIFLDVRLLHLSRWKECLSHNKKGKLSFFLKLCVVGLREDFLVFLFRSVEDSYKLSFRMLKRLKQVDEAL